MIRFCRRKTDRKSQATVAREKAERDLARVKAETPKYRELGEALRELRERNHFAELIASTFRGGNP